MRYFRTSLILIFLSAALAACATPNVNAAPHSTATDPAATSGLSAAPVVEAEVCPSGSCDPARGPSGPPLRLVLPTPGAEPVSAWRPPLYPVPWALSTHDHFYFTRPIAADEINWPVADYRYGAELGETGTIHTGIDIPAKLGTAVLAAGDGIVVWAGWGLFSGQPNDQKDPYGQAIAIRHDFGYQDHTLYTIYGHMSQVDVAEGQWVKAGQSIGLVGQTGFATGPHLHFEVRMDDSTFFTTRNPELWLAPPEGWGVLVGRLISTGGLPLHYHQVIVRPVDDPKRYWLVYSYGPATVHADEYYQENMVLSDLPAGRYVMQIPYFGVYFDYDIEIRPGQVTYFTFQGYKGVSFDPPAPVEELTPTP